MIFSTGSQPGAGLETVCSDAVVGSGVLVVNSGVVIVGITAGGLKGLGAAKDKISK